MYRQCCVLKGKALFALLMAIFILSGCGQGGDIAEIGGSDAVAESADSRFNVDEHINGQSATPSPEATVSPHPSAVPINTEAMDIFYREDDIEIWRAMRRTEADGENIYLAYGEPDLYVMHIGQDEHRAANIDNPQGMDVCHVAIDAHGRIHLLMAGDNNEKWFIWRLDESYQVDKKIEISAYFETKQMPIWFMIDKDGTYYLQWPLEQNGIIVDSDGAFMHKFTLDSLGIGWVRQVAVGKDGKIYIVHGYMDDRREFAKLDTENCSVENANPDLFFPNSEIFTEMASGTDTNILLYSPYTGVWACDTEKGIMENRVKISELKVGFADEFWPFVFLPDGRLVVFGNAADSGGELLRYIPVGR